MKKYNFYDLLKWPKEKPFPDDVNEDAYTQASKLGKDIDVKGMKFYEKPNNKFYGSFYAIGEDGVLYAKFEFIRGFAYKWVLVKYFGNCQSHVERFNKNIFKPKKNERNASAELDKTNNLQTQSEVNDVR